MNNWKDKFNQIESSYEKPIQRTVRLLIFLIFVGIAYQILSPIFIRGTKIEINDYNPNDSIKYIRNYNILILKNENELLDKKLFKILDSIDNASDSINSWYISNFIKSEK